MNKEFWHNKWERNQIGFHLDNVHPLLQKYYNKVFFGSKSVFVPLCGKTLDMRYLFEQDISVVGCELSEIAINEFFKVEKINGTLKVSETKQHKIFKNTNDNSSIEVLVGDYFELDPLTFSKCHSIYDRAALIALQKEHRVLYVETLRKLIPKAKMLLITLDYQQSEMSGPPFSVNEAEVNQLFSFANVERLKRSDILSDEPQFEKKGLKYFYQTAYYIQWQ